MSLPPAWKVKRELRRAHEKARDAVSFRIVDRLRQRHHDRNLARLLRETPGAQPLTARVAVFVLFQPKGIAGSTFFTLDHLAQQGWSVLVISNAPLSDADRTRLSAASGHVIERPNTGYDFGAYREGWRWLERHGHALDRLILMNDSTWFPLRMDDNSLRRMEALNADLAGHIYKSAGTQDHIESHLLMFGPIALQHADIRKFWTKYLMTDSRMDTIILGEVGITQTALAAGLVVKGLLGRDRLVELLADLTDDALLSHLQDLALTSVEAQRQRKVWEATAAAGQPWREDFFAWTLEELTTSREHFVSASFVVPAVRFGGMGFLKKSRDLRFQVARSSFLKAVGAGRLQGPDPVIASEISANTGNPATQTDSPPDPSESSRLPAH